MSLAVVVEALGAAAEVEVVYSSEVEQGLAGIVVLLGEVDRLEHNEIHWH